MAGERLERVLREYRRGKPRDYRFLRLGGPHGNSRWRDGSEDASFGYDGSLLTSLTTGTLAQTMSLAYNDDSSLNSFTYTGHTCRRCGVAA